MAPQRDRLRRLTARVMDELVAFAYGLQSMGLKPDPSYREQGAPLATVMVTTAGDIEFDIRLPRPVGVDEYVGSYLG
jgi:hypothetical protein